MGNVGPKLKSTGAWSRLSSGVRTGEPEIRDRFHHDEMKRTMPEYHGYDGKALAFYNTFFVCSFSTIRETSDYKQTKKHVNYAVNNAWQHIVGVKL